MNCGKQTQTTPVELQLLLFKQQQKKMRFNVSHALGLELPKSSHKRPSLLRGRRGLLRSEAALAQGCALGGQVPETPRRRTEADGTLRRCLLLTVRDRGLKQSPKSSETATDGGARAAFHWGAKCLRDCLGLIQSEQPKAFYLFLCSSELREGCHFSFYAAAT